MIETNILTMTPIWFDYASGFASLVALFFVILYFVKPRMKITNESDYSSNKIRIICENRNIFRNPIKDIKCDIVVSKSSDFKVAKTILLKKAWTPGIRFCDNYTFKNSGNNIGENKRFLKVRILVVNIIGIRKLYEEVFEL